MEWFKVNVWILLDQMCFVCLCMCLCISPCTLHNTTVFHILMCSLKCRFWRNFQGEVFLASSIHSSLFCITVLFCILLYHDSCFHKVLYLWVCIDFDLPIILVRSQVIASDNNTSNNYQVNFWICYLELCGWHFPLLFLRELRPTIYYNFSYYAVDPVTHSIDEIWCHNLVAKCFRWQSACIGN